VGEDAYRFNLPDSNGHKVKLTDRQAGWYLMLVFFRGSWCDACLNQLLDLKRDLGKFAEQKTAVAAISVDDTATLAEFNASWRFPYPLLSDRYLEVIDAYDARHPKGHEGKDISKPLIVIVGPDGKIAYKYLGHSPVDRPSNEELVEWLKQHAERNPAP
jgi:peroxiredoxin